MEADLQRYYQVDLRDRYRTDKPLTLRRIGALISGLPHDSVVHTRLNDGQTWTTTEYLLSDIWQAAANSQKPHPARPGRKPPTVSRDRHKKIVAARQRARARRRAIEAGEIT